MRPTRYLSAFLAAALFSGALAAQPLLVTTTADDFDGICDSHCSLHDAIVVGNSAGSLRQITLSADDYSLTRASASDDNSYPVDEDLGVAGDLDILGQLVIRGAGRDSTRILGTLNSRLIQAHPQARFGLYGVHLEGGDSIADGGAPRNDGDASHPRGSLAWALALGEHGSYLQPRAVGLAVDAAVGSCAGHDQLGAARPQDGDADEVPICDLGAIERSTMTAVQP